MAIKISEHSLTKEDNMGKDTQDRKEEILMTAIKIFSERGFDNTTTKEIASEAGIAEGTIFRYFKTKKDILDSAIIKFIDMADDSNIIGPVLDTLGNAKDKDESEVIYEILKERINFINKNINIIKTVFGELLINNELREKWMDKIIYKVKDAASVYIEEKIKEGKFRDVNEIVAIRSLAGMVFAYEFQKNMMNGLMGIEDEDAEIRMIVDLYINGLKK